MIEDYLPYKHEVSLSDKEKLKDEYFHSMANYYIHTHYYNRSQVTSARNYYSSIRGEEDFQYLEDIYGMQNPIDLGFTNIIKPRVDALVGMSLLSEPDFKVHYTDKETIEEVKKEKYTEVTEELFTYIERSVDSKSRAAAKGEQPTKKESDTNAGIKDFLAKTTKKYSSEYMSSFQIAAEHIIKLIEGDDTIDLANVKKELSKDYFITGEAYTKTIHRGKGKNPSIEIILPDFFYSNRPRLDKDLKRANVVVYKERVSPHQVLKKLGDKITKGDAEKMFSYYGSLSTDEVALAGGAPDANTYNTPQDDMHQLDSFYLKTGWQNGPLNGYGNTEYTGPLVDLYHVEWLASTRIPNGKGSFVYREDRYECYRLGHDIYIGGRRCDEASRTKEEPWKTALSYSGVINVSRSGVIHSLVNSMRELQDLYDIIMFFRNNAVAHSGVSGSRVNVAAIPKNLGKKFMDRLTKWITLRKQGVELIDPTEEGAALFQHYGEFNAAVDGKTIESINAILESLAVQADILSGVPRQLLGIIEERDAVENVKTGINQVSILSLEMFRDVDRCLNRTVQKTLDIFKYAYRKKTLQGVYKNGLAMIPFTLAPNEFSMTDYKVSVVSSGIENAKLFKIQQLAKEFVSAGVIDPDVLVKIINNKSIHEVEYILSLATAAKKEENANIQQMQQQLEEANGQINKLQGEINRLENNAKQQLEGRLELDREKISGDLKNKEEEIKIKKEETENKKVVSEKELAIKGELVQLEREQLLYGPGSSKEIKNNV